MATLSTFSMMRLKHHNIQQEGGPEEKRERRLHAATLHCHTADVYRNLDRIASATCGRVSCTHDSLTPLLEALHAELPMTTIPARLRAAPIPSAYSISARTSVSASASSRAQRRRHSTSAPRSASKGRATDTTRRSASSGGGNNNRNSSSSRWMPSAPFRVPVDTPLEVPYEALYAARRSRGERRESGPAVSSTLRPLFSGAANNATDGESEAARPSMDFLIPSGESPRAVVAARLQAEAPLYSRVQLNRALRQRVAQAQEMEKERHRQRAARVADADYVPSCAFAATASTTSRCAGNEARMEEAREKKRERWAGSTTMRI